MITKSELQVLLLACHESLEAHLRMDEPQDMIEQLSEEILQKTATRPLPSYALLQASPEAHHVFKAILIQHHAMLATKETRLVALTKKIGLELFFLSQSTPSSTERIKGLLNDLLLYNLLVLGDYTALRMQTGIIFKEFKERLNQAFSPEHLNDVTRAFSWILSRCKTNLREKIRAATPPSYRDLTKISLELHSKQCVAELKQESGPAHMINFYESTVSAERGYQPVAPRAAEYLDPYDSDNEAERATSFDKTSHGLGSGVYGLAALDEEQIQRKLKNQSHFKIVEIELPLRLVDNTNVQESDRYTEVSKRLQRICDEIKKLRFAKKSIYASRRDVVHAFFEEACNQQNLVSLAEIFCNFKNIETSVNMMHALLLEAVEEFSIHADSKMNEIVPMPINYLLIKLGFTGVVSTMNDSFSRGLIAIELNDSTDFSFVSIKKLSSHPNSPHPKLRKSPWSGRLTPAQRSLSDDSSISYARSSSSDSDRPNPNPRQRFFASTPPPPEVSLVPIQKPSPQRNGQEQTSAQHK